MSCVRPRSLWALVCALVCVPALLNEPAFADTAPPPHAVLGTFIRGPNRLVIGTPTSLRIVTHWASSPDVSGVLGDVEVSVTLRSLPADKAKAKARERRREALVFRGRTDARGLLEAAFK